MLRNNTARRATVLGPKELRPSCHRAVHRIGYEWLAIVRLLLTGFYQEAKANSAEDEPTGDIRKLTVIFFPASL